MVGPAPFNSGAPPPPPAPLPLAPAGNYGSEEAQEARQKAQRSNQARYAKIVSIADIVISGIILILYIVYAIYGPAGWKLSISFFVLYSIAIAACICIIIKTEALWPVIIWLIFAYLRCVLEIVAIFVHGFATDGESDAGERIEPVIKSDLPKSTRDALYYSQIGWMCLQMVIYSLFIGLLHIYCCALNRKPQPRPNGVAGDYAPVPVPYYAPPVQQQMPYYQYQGYAPVPMYQPAPPPPYQYQYQR